MKKIHAEKYILFLFMVALALVYIVPFLMMGLGSFKNQAEAAKFDLSLPTQWIFSTIPMCWNPAKSYLDM